ncbi:MAG: glycosyltransferase family protein [Longimicrobiales bacterium]|nr:glycosyltransferase family protein [Longimicrobiales bacterium]
MSGLRVAFVVQGEGRGHMTQALALAAILDRAGHEVLEVLVGRSPHRPIPGYFLDGMAAPVRTFEAPAQVADRTGEGLSVGRTVADAVRRTPAFFRSVVAIAERTAEADVVVNFLDLLGGLSRALFPTDVPAVAVAHNYVFLHPRLRGAPGPAAIREMVMTYARVTATGSTRKLALSFDELPDHEELALQVAPPLLRPGLAELEISSGDHLLAYALNPGYADRLARWQRSRPDTPVHCYVEGGEAALTEEPEPGFHVHVLDQRPFLGHLASCRAYVGSAGFESICEAYYLGKAVLAVPTEGQFEQALNAWDAERCGAARWGTYEDLDAFWRSPPEPSADRVRAFRAWVDRGPEIFVGAVERAARVDEG